MARTILTYKLYVMTIQLQYNGNELNTDTNLSKDYYIIKFELITHMQI